MLGRLRHITHRGFLGLTALTLMVGQLVLAVPVSAADFSVSGRVTAGSGSLAVENAVVDVLNPSTSVVVGTDNTDANGDYAVTVPSGIYRVRVTPPASSGYQVSIVNGVDLSSNKVVHFALVASSTFVTFSGIVRDQNGVPQPNVQVQLYCNSGNYSATSEAGGAYSFTIPPTICGELRAGSVHSVDFFDVSGNVIQDITVPAFITLSVNVVDTEGNPVIVPGSTLRGTISQVSPDPPIQIAPGFILGNYSATAQTNSGNTLQFKIVPGTSVTNVHIDGIGQYSPADLENVGTFTQNASVAVQLDRKVTFSGTVRNQNGVPQPFMQIQLFCNSGNYSTSSEGDGTYLFTIPKGPCGELRAGSVHSVEVFNVTGNTVQDITTPAYVKLRVNVVDANGNPVLVPGSTLRGTVSQVSPDPPIQIAPGFVLGNYGQTKTAPSGSNTLEFNIIPGTSVTQVDIDGIGPYSPAGVSDAGTFTQDATLTVQLQRNVLFSGVVRNQNGVPQPGVEVRLSCNTGNYGATSDENGHYELSIPTGPCGELRAGSVYTVEAFHITGDTIQDIIVPTYVTLTVNLINADGSPVSVPSGSTLSGTVSQVSPLPPLETAPGFLIGNYSTSAQVSSGNTLQFKIIPGTVVTLLRINPVGQYSGVDLNNAGTFTGNATLNVQLQQPLPPAVPQNLSGSSPTATSPAITWDVVPGAASYKIFRNGAEVGAVSATSFADASLATDGTLSYAVSACNAFGCSEQSNALAIVYDTTGPTLGTPSWFNNPASEGEDATVTVMAGDALTTVAGGEYFIGTTDPGQGNGTSMNLNTGELSTSLGDDLAPGTYTVHIRARDVLGNWSTVVSTDLIIEPADTTAPIITYALSTPPNANGWHKAPVTLTWNVSDPESAIMSQLGCATVTVNTDGTTTYFCSATSAGGTTNQSVTIKYDATAPAVTAGLSSPANANGWHNANLTIDWQASDSGSGSPTDPANTVASVEAANITYTSPQSCDLAGNCATGSVQLSIDKTAPIQSNFMPAAMLPVIFGSQNFSITSADTLSGVDRVEYYFDTDPGQGNGTVATPAASNTYSGVMDTGNNLPPAQHSFFLRTRDRAGNWSTTLTRTYTEIF